VSLSFVDEVLATFWARMPSPRWVQSAHHPADQLAVLYARDFLVAVIFCGFLLYLSAHRNRSTQKQTGAKRQGRASKKLSKIGEKYKGNRIDESTKAGYRSGQLDFIIWLYDNNKKELTRRCRAKLEELHDTKARKKFIRSMLKSPKPEQLKPLNFASMNPDVFVEYLDQLLTKGGVKPQWTTYQGRQNSFKHLFLGFTSARMSQEFSDQLDICMEGFKKECASRLGVSGKKPGKQEMSFTLYTYLSRAFLTTDPPKTTPKTAKLADEIARPPDDFVDVPANYTDSEATTRDFFFAKLALNLSWNLMCRASNTFAIAYTHFGMGASGDSITIFFAQQKTDKQGRQLCPDVLFCVPVRADQPVSCVCESG
jgi:hypothetical protein